MGITGLGSKLGICEELHNIKLCEPSERVCSKDPEWVDIDLPECGGIEELRLGSVQGIERGKDSKNQPVGYNCHIGAQRSQRPQLIDKSVATAIREVQAMSRGGNVA